MSLHDVDASILGWKVLPIIGKRHVVRLECPHCGIIVEVQRKDISKLEDGTYLFKRLGDAEVHPWTHRGFTRGADAFRALRSLGEVLENLKETERHGDPAHIRAILAVVADVVRPYCPDAADALEAPVVVETRRVSP